MKTRIRISMPISLKQRVRELARREGKSISALLLEFVVNDLTAQRQQMGACGRPVCCYWCEEACPQKQETGLTVIEGGLHR